MSKSEERCVLFLLDVFQKIVQLTICVAFDGTETEPSLKSRSS